MADITLKLTGKINRRFPANEGDPLTEPLVRDNLLSRNGRLKKPGGTEKVSTTALSDRARWMSRYYSFEVGVVSPKTFIYTKDGYLYLQNDMGGAPTLIRSDLSTNAYPRSKLIKYSEQVYLYFVDGFNLYKYDGNNDNRFDKVSSGVPTPFEPIDIEEHLDRLWCIDKSRLYSSANLDFDNFLHATDSLDIVVGSGKGTNLRVIKLPTTDSLYIFTTEGIFKLSGDTISAVATTFGITQVSDKKAISFGSIHQVENGVIFMADDYELYSFDGYGSYKMVSYKEKLSDLVNTYRVNQAQSTYFNNYYQLSFCEKGETENKIEIWYDALEDKCEFVRGRNVAYYLEIDSSREVGYQQFGRSDSNYIMWAERGLNFDGSAIQVRLLSRDITPKKFEEVRFTDFYLDLEPTGERDMFFRYLLDGRLSDLDEKANDYFSLEGEAKFLGLIRIANQKQKWLRIQPKIKYSRGTSIALEITDATIDLDFSLLSMGINFIGGKG